MGRHKKNEMIAAKVVKPSEVTADAPKPEREPRDMNEYIGLAAQVAESTIYCGNWKFKNAAEHFPHEPLLRTVDKFFPHAKGGPLFVDQPTTKQDVEACKRKAEALKAEGLRYVYIERDMNLDEAMTQLTENTA